MASAGAMGHQKVSEVNTATCPKCGKAMTIGVTYPKRKTIWWCACGFELLHVDAKRQGLVKTTYRK